MSKYNSGERINLQKGESPRAGSGNPAGSAKAEVEPFDEKDINRKDLIVDPKSLVAMEDMLDEKIAKENYNIHADNETIDPKDIVYKDDILNGDNFDDDEKNGEETEKAEAEAVKIKDEIDNFTDHALNIEKKFQKKSEEEKKKFDDDRKEFPTHYKRGHNSKYLGQKTPKGFKELENNSRPGRKKRLIMFLNNIIGK